MVIPFTALLTSCSDSGSELKPDTHEEQILPRTRTLSQILNYGVSSPADFDVLRSNSVYPFNLPSQSDFNEYKDSTTFLNGVLEGDRYGLQRWLSENQYKIWFQIANHRNITLEYEENPFMEPMLNEIQYSNQTGYPSGLVFPEDKAVLVLDFKDCPSGSGGCATPL